MFGEYRITLTIDEDATDQKAAVAEALAVLANMVSEQGTDILEPMRDELVQTTGGQVVIDAKGR